MLKNAWKGYNCSIFAYGQTGSGKSYSIMGHGANKGNAINCCIGTGTSPQPGETLWLQYNTRDRGSMETPCCPASQIDTTKY